MRLEAGETVALRRIVQPMLAVARDHADLALAAFERADQRAGDAFFIERLGILAPGAHRHYGFAFARDVLRRGPVSDSSANRRTGCAPWAKDSGSGPEDPWRLAFRWTRSK